MRFAGTCSRYSNKAMPQLTRAATTQGRVFNSLRCPYQAKVMNTFERLSSPTVCSSTIPLLTPVNPLAVSQVAEHRGGLLALSRPAGTCGSRAYEFPRQLE